MAEQGQLRAVRRAALESLLALNKADAGPTISDWLLSGDEQKWLVAAGHLNSLSDAQLASLSDNLTALSTDGVVALIDVMAQRDAASVLPKILALAASDNRELKLAGLRYLGAVGDERADCVVDRSNWEPTACWPSRRSDHCSSCRVSPWGRH